MDDANLASFLLGQEISNKKSKIGATDNFKTYEKSVRKAFDSVVDFCQNPQCRHTSIAKYFGDPKPNCNGHCDFCCNPDAAEESSRKLRNFQQWQGMGMSRKEAVKLSNRGTLDRRDDSDTEFDEFTGLSRYPKANCFGFDHDDNSDNESGGSRSNCTTMEKKAGIHLGNIIRQQLALRRGASTSSLKRPCNTSAGFKTASSLIKKKKL